jgi:hypothetical protein
MIGMPSPRRVKAMAFEARAISVVRFAKRGRSWFSEKEDRMVGSLQV